MNSIGNNISGLIEKQGLTQKALAEKIGKTEASVSRYVNGERIPNANTIKRIAQVLYTTADNLLSEDGDDITVCHCNVKENAELICKIMDCDVDNKVYVPDYDEYDCENCMYKNSSEYDEPCRNCMYSHKSMFKSKPRWVPWKSNDTGNNYGTITVYKCSECGNTETERSPFCRKCGAKMDEVKDDE